MLSRKTAVVFSLALVFAGSALAGSDPCAGMKGSLKAHCEKEQAAKEKKAHECDRLKGKMKEKCQKAFGIPEAAAKKDAATPTKAAAPAKGAAPAKAAAAAVKKPDEAPKSGDEEVTLFD